VQRALLLRVGCSVCTSVSKAVPWHGKDSGGSVLGTVDRLRVKGLLHTTCASHALGVQTTVVLE
jgi:hypothetical protein